ncbi:hypothetical protein BV98_000114 [Sphingobium herbicidovorans NBRC 16415]|uniref:Uncharacterized protein n=1 Tax=Sphingobium herbicidovorans (strain ATCC 700291 / DSM 11019 / CCUG 56400 / KCTC 2939 / LMG 18315 / NBRC 16415 / MH) TaxID=1219045 RepID=A0A086PEP7_SPHHM|nr:DUF5677 domain-containing protein [Sphingobium herbicidovorans]KFG91865.1 hypothetical protein BV98_000114 [Sphingobium herbicidovorans NBRC 16415]
MDASLIGEGAVTRDWQAVDRDFRNYGFLATEADAFRFHFRELLADWFSLAERINALGQRMYVECSDLLPGQRVLSPTSLGLQMMPRCLSGFQGALILAERGLGVEAQALVRSVFETAFWMGYVISDPTVAVPQLRGETLNSEIRLFEASLRHLSGMGTDNETQVRSQLSEMKAEYARLPKPPTMEKIASAAGYGPSYFFYKDLSGAATHLSLKSIHGFLHHDEAGEVIGHQVGPDEESVGKAVWLACRAMTLAVHALGRLPGCSAYSSELDPLNHELGQLKPYEPVERNC